MELQDDEEKRGKIVSPLSLGKYRAQPLLVIYVTQSIIKFVKKIPNIVSVEPFSITNKSKTTKYFENRRSSFVEKRQNAKVPEFEDGCCVIMFDQRDRIVHRLQASFPRYRRWDRSKIRRGLMTINFGVNVGFCW